MYGDPGNPDDPLLTPAERGPNRCYESVTVIETPFHKIRVWRTEPGLLEAIDADALDQNNDLRRVVKGLTNMRHLFAALEACPRVAAIEITDRQAGHAAILYPDWK